VTQTQDNERPPVAGITTAIGDALVQAAAAAADTDGTGRTQDAAEVRAITEAMVRLLAGVPLRSDGQLTI